MKLINTLLTILFISLLSSPSWSVTIDDLVKREGLYYKQFTDVPFTGKITGGQQVSFKNGLADGAWVTYYENGQLFFKGSYKNGKKEGAWVRYYDNGQLFYKGNFKNGKKEGAWVRNHSDGTLSKTLTGTYKNGKRISD
jgi:hypothetical protein